MKVGDNSYIKSFSHLEGTKIEKNVVERNFSIIDLIISSKFEISRSEIRRLIKGKAIKINNLLVTDEKLLVNKDHYKEGYLKLSIGKKRHIKVELN